MKPDAGYRRTVIAKCPTKLRLEALAKMTRPSVRTLLRLIRDPHTPEKLRMAASNRLAEIQRQREINQLLQSERERLGDKS